MRRLFTLLGLLWFICHLEFRGISLGLQSRVAVNWKETDAFPPFFVETNNYVSEKCGVLLFLGSLTALFLQMQYFRCLVRKLLTYIGGNNEQAMGIAFPIIITVYPRNDGVFSRRLAVGIRIPNAYQQDPPAPTDSTIRVEERPGMTVYALYVSFVTAARLTRALGETTPFQRKQYFCCSYDPPLKPYGRRNEVWLLQEDP
uniref:Heme-binding protein 1 n=1 Tax=Poecilia mexicana TaxID=48701 RepID=A0A3B3YUQ1_9TELE